MKESLVEGYLVRRVKELGGECFKWGGAGDRGKPDRMIMVRGQVWFVEVKGQGGRLRKLQKWWLERLEDLGFQVAVVYSREEVDALMVEIEGKGKGKGKGKGLKR